MNYPVKNFRNSGQFVKFLISCTTRDLRSQIGTQPQWYVHPTKAAMCTALASSVWVPSDVRNLTL